MMNSFWWETNNQSSKGIHSFNWEKLSMKKEFGGLGFRHLHAFNVTRKVRLEIDNQA